MIEAFFFNIFKILFKIFNSFINTIFISMNSMKKCSKNLVLVIKEHKTNFNFFALKTTHFEFSKKKLVPK